MDGCMTQYLCFQKKQAIVLKLRLGVGQRRAVTGQKHMCARTCVEAVAVHYGAEPTAAT